MLTRAGRPCRLASEAIMQDTESGVPIFPLGATFRDGRSAILRLVQPDDEGAFEAAFNSLSSHSRYTRFLAPMRQLPPKMLHAAAHPSPDHEIALVAIAADGADARIVGGSRVIWAPGADAGEFAVTIVDDWQGIGLARRLMETLIALARARRLRCMEGFVLSENMGMRRLAGRLGFTDARCPGDATLRVVSLDLQ